MVRSLNALYFLRFYVGIKIQELVVHTELTFNQGMQRLLQVAIYRQVRTRCLQHDLHVQPKCLF